MRRRVSSVFLLSHSLFLLSHSLFAGGALLAQDAPPLVTDRPDQTESPAIVPAGVVQLEAGAVFSRFNRQTTVPGNPAVDARTGVLELGGVLARIGVARRLEARIGFAGFQRITETGVPTVDGAGDADIGVKFQVAPGERRIPQAAIIAGVILPTAAAGLGVDAASPTVRLALAHELSPRLSFGWNVGAEFLRSDAGGRTETDIDLIYTAVLGVAATDRVGLFVEGFGTLSGQDLEPDRHLLDGGITYRLLPNVQLDASGGVGLSAAAEDWFVGAGVSVRVPR